MKGEKIDKLEALNKMVRIENKLQDGIQSMEEDTKEPQIGKTQLQEIERNHHRNSKWISNGSV